MIGLFIIDGSGDVWGRGEVNGVTQLGEYVDELIRLSARVSGSGSWSGLVVETFPLVTKTSLSESEFDSFNVC